MEGRKSETALGTARARFVEGLPRKAGELKAAIALLASAPEAARPREELRRRLHALYASAQVFHLEPLADALREAIGSLDSARDASRPLSQDEVDGMASLAATLPALVTNGGAPSPSTAPPRVRSDLPPAPSRPARHTLRGLASAPPVASERPSKSPPRRAAGSFTAARAPSSRPPPPSLTPLDTIISVLVIDDVESQARVRAALPVERFELVGASDPEQGLRLARMGAPDVVVASRDVVMRGGSDFIRRLRSDPLTDFVPVILLLHEESAQDLVAVREEGADATLGKPFDDADLYRTIVRVTGNLPGGDDALGHLGDLTPEELVERLTEELRRGLVETAETGRDVRVPIGDGAEVLAAAWSAISRVRATLAQRSGGRVRFKDGPRRGGPAVMALVDEAGEPTARGDTIEVSLRDRRIVVADDDPAVVWFFAGLLREEGADVFEASNGREALEEARRRRPDLIISDILMPEIDGFELCRSLARDPALADVPVILLSWKEDFLQRMRDLSSGASGYLRKEAGSALILERVREVLKPRARLEAQLEAGGELRGRIEGVGMTTLLRTVAEHRPNARVTARDAWNLFEVDVRDGRIVDVTRTATDGSFARGPKALPQLLGVTTGRFTVVESETAVRGTFDAPIEEVIVDGTARLGAVLDAVAGRGMRHAARVRFDEDVLASFVRTSPEPIKKIVERLTRGDAPRDLLLDDEVAPHALDSALVDLARRGAIAEVIGDDGDDRVIAALRERAPVRVSRPPADPADVVALDEGEARGSEDEEEPEDAEIVSAPGAEDDDARSKWSAATPVDGARRPRKRKDSVDELDLPFSGGDEEEGEPVRASEESTSGAEAEPIELVRPSTPPSSSRPPPARVSERPASALTRSEPPADKKGPDTWRPKPGERSEPGTLAWMFLLVVLGVLGFVGYELLEGGTDSDEVVEREDDGTDDDVPPPDEGPETPTPPEVPDPGDVPPQELSYGLTIPGIDPAAGVTVGEGEGLLVIEAPEHGVAPAVQIGAREVGDAPTRLALPAGRHELIFRRGEETSYRYLYVRAGETRVIRSP